MTYDQKARAEERRKRWEELVRLSDANNVFGFFARYADYLEWDNLVSGYRIALHKMARKAAKDPMAPGFDVSEFYEE